MRGGAAETKTWILILSREGVKVRVQTAGKRTDAWWLKPLPVVLSRTVWRSPPVLQSL